MEEIRHRLTNKKIWIFLFVLIIVNVFSLWKNNAKVKFEDGSLTAAVSVSEYQKYISDTISNAKRMLLLGNLREDNGFAKQNINKTVHDFEVLKDLKWDSGDVESIARLLDNGLYDYMLLAFVLFIAVIFYEERKNGMWFLKHCYYNGRGVNTLKLLFSGFLWIYLAQIVLNLTGYIYCGRIYGFSDLSLPVQALYGHKTVTLEISIWGYWLLDVSIRNIGFMLVLTIIYFILILVNKENVALLIGCVWLGAESLIYNSIGMDSSMIYLKAMNIWMLVRQDNLMRNYKNLSLFGGISGMQVVVVIASVMALVIAISLTTIISSKQYPVVSRERRNKGNIFAFVGSKMWFAGGNFRLEQSKVFILKGGWIALLFILWMFYFAGGEKVSYGEFESYRSSLYSDMEQMPIEETSSYIESEIQNINEQIEDSKNKLSHLSDDALWDVGAVRELMKKLEKKKAIAEELLIYSKQLQIYYQNGEKVGVVNDLGYGMLFSSSDKNSQMEMTFVLLLFIVLMVSTGMAYENRLNMDKLVHASEIRKNTLIKRKLLAYAGWVALAAVITDISAFVRMNRSIGLKGLSLSTHSLAGFMDNDSQMYIWQLLLVLVIISIIMSLLIMLVIVMLTAKIRRMATAVVLMILLFIVLPFAYMLGISMVEPLCINKYLCIYQRIKLWL